MLLTVARDNRIPRRVEHKLPDIEAGPEEPNDAQGKYTGRGHEGVLMCRFELKWAGIAKVGGAYC